MSKRYENFQYHRVDLPRRGGGNVTKKLAIA
jgi:hypothetical protein